MYLKRLMPSILVNLLKIDNKISDNEAKIPNFIGLATTTTTPTAVELNIPSVNDIYQKIKSNNLYINRLTDYNKFMKDIFDAKIKEKKLLNLV